MSRAMMVLAAVVAVAAMWIVAVRPALEHQLETPEAEPNAPSPPMQTPPPPPLAAKPEPPIEPAQLPGPSEPPAQPDTPAAPPPPAKAFWSDMIKGDQGPVAEYRKRYQSEARDDAAMGFETHIREAFDKAKARDMLQTVSCHRSICKLTLRWSDARTGDYIKSLTFMGLGSEPNPGRMGFDLPLALSPAGDKAADGVRPVELFLLRR